MKPRKPRTALHRNTNQKLASRGPFCEHWNDGCPECFLPFAGDGDKECKGNPFRCNHLIHSYLASVTTKINRELASRLEWKEKAYRLQRIIQQNQ